MAWLMFSTSQAKHQWGLSSWLNFEGVGGVVQNDKSEFLAGFTYRKHHVASPHQIELFAIRDGIEFLQSLQVTAAVQPVLHSDCLLTVIAITSVGEDLFFFR